MTMQMPMPVAEGAIAPSLPDYRPRLFAPLGLWTKRNWAIKAYGIHHDVSRDPGHVLDEPVADAAREHVLSRLAEAEAEGNHYACGFAIVHQARGENFVVFNWWAHENICCEALGHASGKATAFNTYSGPIMACIWELAVIQFERRAWIEHVMRPEGSIAAYLDARLAPGTY